MHSVADVGEVQPVDRGRPGHAPGLAGGGMPLGGLRPPECRLVDQRRGAPGQRLDLGARPRVRGVDDAPAPASPRTARFGMLPCMFGDAVRARSAVRNTSTPSRGSTRTTATDGPSSASPKQIEEPLHEPDVLDATVDRRRRSPSEYQE